MTVGIPSEETSAQHISEGDVAQLQIQRRANIKYLFGTVKFYKSSQEMKDKDKKI